MGDWDRSDLISLSPSVYPPEFMWVEEGDDNKLEDKTAVVQRHYNSFVEILNGGTGYEALTTVRERLGDHLSRAREEAAPLKSRREYLKLCQLEIKKELDMIAREQSDTEEEIRQEADRLLDEPIGEWIDEDGTLQTVSSTEEWAISVTGPVPSIDTPDKNSENDPEVSQYSVTAQYRPNSKTYGIEFNEDHLRPSDKGIFSGRDTWGEILESTRQQYIHLKERYERARQTVELLRFRLAVVKTVLYHFEAYGAVEEMTQERAEKIARKERDTRSERMMEWEINAAQLYAYAQEHGQPSSMDEWEDETKVSTRQAWDRLQENDYGIGGTGATGLHNALKEWAPEFEQKYETKKAKRAASPFNWPDELEA